MGNAQTEKKKRQRKNKRYREWLKRRLDAATACPETNCDGDCENCLAAGDDSLYEAGDHK